MMVAIIIWACAVHGRGCRGPGVPVQADTTFGQCRGDGTAGAERLSLRRMFAKLLGTQPEGA